VFTADQPSQLWLTDISEHKAVEGTLYLFAVKDVFSNRIVGYSIDPRMKSRLAVSAIENAVRMRGEVAGCVVHSDYAEDDVMPRMTLCRETVPMPAIHWGQPLFCRLSVTDG
jgi:putative transposase